jgi:hypothetical protein
MADRIYTLTDPDSKEVFTGPHMDCLKKLHDV